jgi:hypothetical protein
MYRHYTHTHTGSGVYFTYGHVRDNFIAYAHSHTHAHTHTHEQKTLYVMMIREPLSWLLSRHQHTVRKMHTHAHAHTDIKSMSKRQRQKHIQQLPSLVDTAVQYGDKYFNFLPDTERAVASEWFKRAVSAAVREQHLRKSLYGTATDGHNSSGVSSAVSEGSSDTHTPFEFASSAAALSASLDILLFQPLHHSSTHSSSSAVLVLVTEYFEESMKLLDHVYATTHFTTSAVSEGSSDGYRNRAQGWQDQGLFSTSPAEMKTVSRLLEVHHTLYNACLRVFLRTCAGVV